MNPSRFSSGPAPDFEDSTFSSGWTASGSNVTAGTNVIDWNAASVSAHHAIAYDIGAGNISDSEWILRFGLTFDNMVDTTGGGDRRFYLGFFAKNQSAKASATDDAIYLCLLNQGAVGDFRMQWNDGSAVRTGNTMTQFDEVDDPVAQTYYVEIVRSSTTTGLISLYSDSDYSSLIDSLAYVPTANVAGLRYLKFMSDDGSDGTGGSMDGTITDVKFYNAISSF